MRKVCNSSEKHVYLTHHYNEVKHSNHYYDTLTQETLNNRNKEDIYDINI